MTQYQLNADGSAPVNIVGSTVLAKDSKDNAIATATAAAGTAAQRYILRDMIFLTAQEQQREHFNY